jgi:hypothetical protein
VTDSEPGPDRQHDAKDAHVQVLTAEVRTLVVGSRQVTLSVYGQLDTIPLIALTPFGRVRIKETPSSDWRVTRVVGADRDGRLVASWLGYTTTGRTFSDPGGIWANSEDGVQVWGELQDLPLIVLAGLR